MENDSSSDNKHKGFTLIELMVAIAVMALLAMLSWRGLDGMMRAQTQTQEKTDDVMAIQAGLAQWQTDLDNIFEIKQLPSISALDYDGQVLRIVRRYTEKNNDLIRVIAWSQHTKNDRQQWLRWQSEPVRTRGEVLSAWLQAKQWAQTPTEAEQKRELNIAPIDQWQLVYYRNNAWTNPLSSADAMIPGSTPLQLPDGIRLVLTLSSGQAITGQVTRDWARPTHGGGKS